MNGQGVRDETEASRWTSRFGVRALQWILELWVKQRRRRKKRESELTFRPSEFLVSEEKPPLPPWVRFSLGGLGGH